MVDNVVTGLPQLSKEFGELSQQIQKQTGRRMVAAGAGHAVKSVKRTIKSKGLVKSGALLRNVVKQRDRRPPQGQIRYGIKVRHGKHIKANKVSKTLAKRRLTGGKSAQRKNDPYYWRFLELGWQTTPKRSIKNKGGIAARRRRVSKRTRVQPKRFLRGGWVMSQPGIEPEMIKAFQKDMAKRRSNHGKQMIKWGYR